MGKKLLTALLAAEMVTGVTGVAHAPGIVLPAYKPTKQEIILMDKNALKNPELEKKIEDIRYKIALANAVGTEQQERADPGNYSEYDFLYGLVKRVYSSVKDRFDIPSYMTPEFFRAMIKTESTSYQYAVSSAGAMGYTQMTPAAAADVGVSGNFEDHAFNAWDSIDMSMAYFAWIDRKLSSKYPGWDKLTNFEKLRNDADAYNMGWKGFLHNCFDDNGKFTEKYLPLETYNYFGKILSHWQKEFPDSFEFFMQDAFPNYPQVWEEYVPRYPPLEEVKNPSKGYQQG